MCEQCDSSECRDLIEGFLKLYPEAAFGPGHVVLDDYNLEDRHIEWCLETPGLWTAAREGHSDEELVATRAFLELLKLIPESMRLAKDDHAAIDLG